MPTALVTGASAGIGAAVARRLAEAGYTVYGAARRVGRVEALGVRALRMDLRDEASILAGFDLIRDQVGGVDLLVNNAGLGHDAPLTTGDTEHWREMLEVNVLALCVCTREAVSDMRRRGDQGHVVHVSSMAAHRVPGGSGVYSATKFAVRSLTEGLRLELRELGSDIRVTSISPGYVETEFAERYHKSADAAARTYGRFPVLQPEDVAEAVLYAVSAPPHVQVHDLLMRPTQQPS